MSKSSKPRVATRCPANTYTGPNERIIEFAGPLENQGGLISFRATSDGKMVVELYRLDCDVEVKVGKPEAKKS